jgi:hypothetical protein
LSSSFVVIFVVDHDRHEEDEAIVTILTQGRFISPSTISLLRRRGELNYEQLKLYEDGSKPLSDIGIKGTRPTQRFLEVIKKIPKKSRVESHDVDANEATSLSASDPVIADSAGLSHHSRLSHEDIEGRGIAAAVANPPTQTLEELKDEIVKPCRFSSAASSHGSNLPIVDNVVNEGSNGLKNESHSTFASALDESHPAKTNLSTISLSKFKGEDVPRESAFKCANFKMQNDDLADALVTVSSFFTNADHVRTFVSQWALHLDQLQQALGYERGENEQDVTVHRQFMLLFMKAMAEAAGLDPLILSPAPTNFLTTIGGVTFSGTPDLVRHVDKDDVPIAHHYEIMRTFGDLSTSSASPKNQTMGENFTLSVINHSIEEMIAENLPISLSTEASDHIEGKIVRGLCMDLLVSHLCTCWYVPEDNGWGGVQYIEDRFMNYGSYVLRLLFSFFAIPDPTLKEIIDKSSSTIPSFTTSKTTNSRNKKGNGGINDDLGGDEFEDEIDSEEEEERLRAWSSFLNWDRICRGELPFTKENIDLCASLTDSKNQRVSDFQSEES